MPWETTDERFVNPYNFVRLNGCQRSELKPVENPLTGYIEYTLKTRSPVLIPNTSCDHALPRTGDAAENTKSYDFFSYDDLSDGGSRLNVYSAPVIPGSEIRGVIRSAFEAAFHGCMSQIDLDTPLYRRTSTYEAKLPGILEKDASGQWVLYRADKEMLLRQNNHNPNHGRFMTDAEYAQLREGERIYVQLNPNEYRTSRDVRTHFHVIEDWRIHATATCPAGFVEGYLHKGRDFIRKHHESVFCYSGGRQVVPLLAGAVERLKAVMAVYADKKINRTHGGYGEFDESASRHLVYYSTDDMGNAKYLSPACITKEVFENSLRKTLPKEYHPCEEAMLCAACVLFGRVMKDHSNGGRIRFTDANPVVPLNLNAYYDAPVVIPATSGPKPSTAEFYSVRPGNAAYWTYDYSCTGTGNTVARQYLKPTFIKPRGRKFYWHGAVEPARHTDRPLKNLEMRMRPLKSGLAFSGRVYFNDVSHDELVRLIWCLTLNGSNEHAHKIGHAKPYGFGSVQISDVKVMRRQIDRETCVYGFSEHQSFEEFRNDFGALDGQGGHPDAAREDLLGITRLEFGNMIPGFPDLVRYPMGEDTTCWLFDGNKDRSAPDSDLVRYPMGEDTTVPLNNANRSASHQWFIGNRDHNRFEKVLPTIQQELEGNPNFHLFKMEKRNQNGPGYHGGHPVTHAPNPQPGAHPGAAHEQENQNGGIPVQPSENMNDALAKLRATGMVKDRNKR